MNHGVVQTTDQEQSRSSGPSSRPFVITFSGIDGAGKTTQIEYLSSRLQKQGLRVLRLSFWDHVAIWAEMRAGVGHRSTTSLAHRMTEPSFAPRNNKHVRKWYLTAARAGFYVFDVVRLHRLLASQRIRDSDVVIFDRYIYDQIANIYSRSLAARFYSNMLLKQAPAPDLAFVLDASPPEAFARKPEYPLEFMHQNREKFLHLTELVPNLIIIPDAGVEDVTREVYLHISRSPLADRISTGEKTDPGLAGSVVPSQSSCSLQNDTTASS